MIEELNKLQEKKMDMISEKQFGSLLTNLESQLMKKFCLTNYFDRQKEHINDFVVTYYGKKDEANNSIFMTE